MANIILSDEQVIQLIKQLPLERKIEVAAYIEAELAQLRSSRRERYWQRLREFAQAQGVDRDTLSLAERGRFVLTHIDEIIQLASSDEAKQRRESLTCELRRLAAERGLDWDNLSEEERLAFIDELMDE